MWMMNPRFRMPTRVELMKGPFRVTGLLFLGLGFLSACDLAYPTSQWADSDVDHAAISGGFELTGIHQNAACSSCHASSDYALKFDPANNGDCQACHLPQYQAKHGAQGYPTTCTLCHAATDWGEGSFNHQTSSGGFDLWGPHAPLACTACHVPGSFEPRYNPSSSSDCAACH